MKIGQYKRIRTKLLVDIELELVDDGISDEETVKYLVEQDLEDADYTVYSCKIID